jgi:hypothetical protein
VVALPKRLDQIAAQVAPNSGRLSQRVPGREPFFQVIDERNRLLWSARSLFQPGKTQGVEILWLTSEYFPSLCDQALRLLRKTFDRVLIEKM